MPVNLGMDRINAITRDCFNALTQLRRLDASNQPSPDMLHTRLRGFIERVMRRGAELGFSQQDVQDIAYAIVALADEVVLTQPGPLREYWLPRMLQLQYFNENIAGDGFFNRLAAIRQDPSRIEVLRVYYLCLLFGFQGKYRVRGGEVELANIIDELASYLTRLGVIREAELAPHGARPKDGGGGVRRHVPLVSLAVVAAVLSLGLYFGLRLGIESEANDVNQRIEALSAS